MTQESVFRRGSTTTVNRFVRQFCGNAGGDPSLFLVAEVVFFLKLNLLKDCYVT